MCGDVRNDFVKENPNMEDWGIPRGPTPKGPCTRIPTVSIAVPFSGLTNFSLRNLKGNPKKELQQRL